MAVDDYDDDDNGAVEPVEMPEKVEPTDDDSDDLSGLSEADLDDAITLAMHQESNKRLWIKTLMPVLHMVDRESSHRSDGLQSALDSLAMATIARMKRVIRSDGPGG